MQRQIAGRYELQLTLGEGGMGIVWLAEDTLLQRYVAVKELRLSAASDVVTGDPANRLELRERLLREARAAGRLNHPGATTVYDVVEEGGDAYIVMELVRAPSLLQVVRDRGPCGPALGARIGLALVDTLEAAHAAGIVHRDVKPGNVLITPQGGVKLTDFGIAAVQGDPLLTATGMVLGSPAYMAPEQARGDRVTAAADVWALGATLYFAVEGVGPFDREHAVQTLAAVLQHEPRPPRRLGPLGPALQATLDRDPDRRVSLSRLRTLLEPVAAQQPAAAEPEPDSYGPVVTGQLEPERDSESSGLRDMAGKAAQELGPAVSSLLAQHEARYPALRQLRSVLVAEEGAAAAPAPTAPAPQPGAVEPQAAPRRERLRPLPAPEPEPARTPQRPHALAQLRDGVNTTWRAIKILTATLVFGTLLVIGWLAYELFSG